MQSSETLLRAVTPSPFSRTQHHVQATRPSRAQARLSAAHSKTDVISFRLTQILLLFCSDAKFRVIKILVGTRFGKTYRCTSW